MSIIQSSVNSLRSCPITETSHQFTPSSSSKIRFRVKFITIVFGKETTKHNLKSRNSTKPELFADINVTNVSMLLFIADISPFRVLLNFRERLPQKERGNKNDVEIFLHESEHA